MKTMTSEDNPMRFNNKSGAFSGLSKPNTSQPGMRQRGNIQLLSGEKAIENPMLETEESNIDFHQ